MVYKVDEIGTYYNKYSADFAAKTHAKASNSKVVIDVYNDNAPEKLVAVLSHYPNGSVKTKRISDEVVLL